MARTKRLPKPRPALVSALPPAAEWYLQSPAPTALLDLEGRVLRWNQAAERLFGFSAQEAAGRVAPMVPEGGLNAFWQVFARVRAGETLGPLTVRPRHKDGHLLSMLLTCGPLRDEQGRVAAVLGVLTDVSDRALAQDVLRASEARFRETLRSLHLTAVLLDAAGNVTFCNDHMLALTGRTLSEVLGLPWTELFLPAGERARLKELFARAMAGATLPPQVEFPIVAREGGTRAVVWDATVLRDLDGSVTGAAAIGRDVTDLRRLEEQYRQAQKMEAVGRLAGGIAHDFNNLMTVILGYSELALRELPAGPMRDWVQAVHAAGERARTLTRQLLAFGRKQVLDVRPVDLNAALLGMERMIRRVIGEHIEVRTELDMSAGPAAADAAQVEQMVVNLVINARDAMPRGGVLTLRTKGEVLSLPQAGPRGLAPGAYVALSVTDTGCGMDEETKRRLFEPFFTTKAPGAGTGLGLATVYGIVKQHGGDIAFSSAPGKGSCFTILLPQGPATAEPRLPTVHEASAVRGSETVLLVEDDPPLRDYVTELLQRLGYRVLAAADAEAAAAQAAAGVKVELLLSDVVLPRVNGPELYDLLRRLHPGLVPLYMTGYAREELARLGILTAEASVLQKPFSWHALARRIREVLAGTEAPGGDDRA